MSLGLRGMFFLPGTFAPAIVAIWLTARAVIVAPGARLRQSPAWHLLGVLAPAALSDTGKHHQRPELPRVPARRDCAVRRDGLALRAHGRKPFACDDHACAINNTTGIVPSGSGDVAFGASLMSWLTTAVLWIGAVYFLIRIPRRHRHESDPMGFHKRGEHTIELPGRERQRTPRNS